MSARPDPGHGLAPPPDEREACEAWFAARLALLHALAADRALSPAARHVLVELLLDAVEDASLPEAEDDDQPLSGRLAARLGLTPRAVRKALAELETLGLISERARGEALVLPGAIAEHLRRGTDAPLGPVEAAADPTEAHAARLEGLRTLALADGRIATALSAQRALAQAFGFQAPARRLPTNDDDDILTRPAPEQLSLHYDRVIRFLRDFYVGDPAYQDDLLTWIAEVRSAGGEAQDDLSAVKPGHDDRNTAVAL